ncbi:endoglucanase [bacterium A37T11]|nr:endoglucanase [bacterium A37T11]
MKKIRYITPFLLCCFMVAFLGLSCSKKEPAPDPELITSVQELKLANDGETKAIHIKSNLNWSAVSDGAWCTVTPSSGSPGTVEISLKAEKNTLAESRQAQITFTAGSLSKQIKVTQDPAIVLEISKKSVDVLADGEQITVELQSSVIYTISTEQGWISQVAGGSTQTGTTKTETFKIAANPGLAGRQGTILFTAGTLTQEVSINQAAQPANIAADKTGMESDAPALAQKLHVGWNLGNSLESAASNTEASETLWGNPPTTKALIDAVKQAGFNTVRIPCAWSGYIVDATTYKISDDWLSRVKEVVNYCVDNGMYAIVDIHWDGGWLENNPTYAQQEVVNKKQKALWQQIALNFRNYDEHLLFAGTNEVHANYGTPTTENITVQQSFNQTFVDAVRATGGKNAWRNLIVQSYNTSITYARDYLKMPVDATANREMAEVHFYDPWDFCGDEASSIYLWGKDYKGNSHTSTWGQEDAVDASFSSMKTNFIDKGIPVILGEYGAILRSSLTTGLADHLKARNYYLNYVTKSAKVHGLVPIYWDNGNTGNNGFGLFNRTTGEAVNTDAITAIISAAL